MEDEENKELTAGLEPYSGHDLAEKTINAGMTKAGLGFSSTLTLALVAGVFIGLGAAFATLVVTDSGLHFGMSKLMGGLAFCLGLILVVVAGAELFTGNNLIVMGVVSGRVPFRKLLRNWIIVFIGNFIGGISLVLVVFLARTWALDGGKVGITALLIANKKVNLDFWTAFFRGVLCNALVCLAIWLCYSARTVTDKILAILFPITAFVALGFEHCVANMYFIPMGIALKHSQPFMKIVAEQGILIKSLGNLTFNGFISRNLLPVTLGNIMGGSVMVGVVYWFTYIREWHDVNFSVLGFDITFMQRNKAINEKKVK